jgi:DNA-binding GntR family transcriptional regulator
VTRSGDEAAAAASPVPSIGTSHQPLRTLVCDELRRRIVTGELPPGSRLVEDRLALQLGVSRNPVRESLQVLAGEGFVELLPRRGAVVARVTAEQAEELFDVRMALESLAARLAARRRDPAALARLRDVLVRAREATEQGELDRLAACNTEFHQQVVAAGANTYLSLLVAPMARRVQWVFRTSAADRGPHSWTEHEALLRAIEAGDEEHALALASAHVAAARASYRRHLEARPDVDPTPAVDDPDDDTGDGALASGA